MGAATAGTVVDTDILQSQGHWWEIPTDPRGRFDTDDLGCNLMRSSVDSRIDCAGKSIDDCKIKCLKDDNCAGISPEALLQPYDCVEAVFHKLQSSTSVANRFPATFGAESCCKHWHMLRLTQQPKQRAPGNTFPLIWPLPKYYKNGTDIVALSRNFKITVTDNNRPARIMKKYKVLSQAIERYERMLLQALSLSKRSNATSLNKLEVLVDDPRSTHPQLGDDERYNLTITASSAVLKARTVVGCLRGLETFSQLVEHGEGMNAAIIRHIPWVIVDQPRFPHRGLLIDTSRHFVPVQWLLRIITSLSYAKINVLHWHVVDTHSFPIEVPSFPHLWDGAYSPAERYTTDDINKVIRFAREHGVRVMIELDVPGHAASWCKGYPEVCPSQACDQPLNVANAQTFSMISGIFDDLITAQRDNESPLFPYDLVHLGGDEVEFDCWKINKRIMKWLQARGMSVDDGFEYFVQRASKAVRARGKTPVHWDEVFDKFGDRLNKTTVIHVWTAKSKLKEVVNAGYQAILSNHDNPGSWYLDLETTTWIGAYNNEPCDGISKDLCRSRVLGGQGQLWTEFVDPSNIESKIWPRLAAIAERLWSPETSLGEANEAAFRLKFFRCLLLHRGIGSTAVDEIKPQAPGGCFA